MSLSPHGTHCLVYFGAGPRARGAKIIAFYGSERFCRDMGTAPVFAGKRVEVHLRAEAEAMIPRRKKRA